MLKKSQNINLKNKISLTYKKYQQGFYVNSKNFVNNIEGRYLARPAIVDYRIIAFNHDFVKFWFQSPDSDKKQFITLEIKNSLAD